MSDFNLFKVSDIFGMQEKCLSLGWQLSSLKKHRGLTLLFILIQTEKDYAAEAFLRGGQGVQMPQALAGGGIKIAAIPPPQPGILGALVHPPY